VRAVAGRRIDDRREAEEIEVDLADEDRRQVVEARREAGVGDQRVGPGQLGDAQRVGAEGQLLEPAERLAEAQPLGEERVLERVGDVDVRAAPRVEDRERAAADLERREAGDRLARVDLAVAEVEAEVVEARPG
jgi:hypothetical protein